MLFIFFTFSVFSIYKYLEKFDKKNIPENFLEFFDIFYIILGIFYPSLIYFITKKYLITFFQEEKRTKILFVIYELVFYIPSTIFLFSQFSFFEISSHTEKNYFSPYFLNFKQKAYYLFRLGHAIISIIKLLVEKKNSQFQTYFFHHLLTIFLISESFLVFKGNFGFLIFFYFDSCEIFVHLARLCRMFKKTKFLFEFFMVFFYLNWGITRVFFFFKDFVLILINNLVLNPNVNFPCLVFFSFCILTLYLLNLFWYYQISKAIYLSFIKKSDKIPFEDENEVEKKLN